MVGLQCVDLFQNDKNGIVAQRYSVGFTLWNTYTGNVHSRFDDKVERPDLLQPANNHRCAYMALLFGTMPSWHSMQCNHAYTATLICKSRVKDTHTTPTHLTSKYEYTECHSTEVFVIDTCFDLKPVENFEPKSSVPFEKRIPIENYFINLLSLMARQSLQGYQLIVQNDARTDEPNYCVTTYVPHWSEFDYVRRVKVHRSPCAKTNGRTIFYVQSTDSRPLMTCGVNQFQCDDGTCISQQFLCEWPYDCSPSKCVCWVEGRDIHDIGYCRDGCLPGKCLCPKHHFQCTAGGCIQVHLVCDGQINCQDGSDEFCVKKHTIPTFGIKQSATKVVINRENICLGHLCQFGKCIPLRYVNDLMSDCSSLYANDEYLFLRLRFNNERFVCRDPQAIPCVAGLPVCFTLKQLCLYDLDQFGITRWCRNGAHLGDCVAINCTNSYKCPGSYCVPFHRVCDGHQDCINGEDEERCDEYICKHFLRCSGSRICVHPTHVCDGIKHCPNADDEILCDVRSCPLGCDCLSYSMICTTDTPNIFPVVIGDYIEHISIVNSYMPFPRVTNICKQNKLFSLKLTRNKVLSICDALQGNCKFRNTLIVLDLAWNSITSLRPFCFYWLVVLKWISLAHNPLVSIDNHVFEHSLVSYIDIRGTELRTLSLDIIQGMTNLKSFNIMDLQLSAIDAYTQVPSSNYVDILFNDKRFCCIFNNDKHCRNINDLSNICRTLLPNRLFGYMLATVGVLSIIFNGVAITANVMAYRGRKLPKLISFLCFIDAALASYLPYLGIADIYHDIRFVFAAEQWHRGHMCNFMDVLSSSGAMVSLCLSGLVIYLTSQGVVKIRFSIDDVWHKLLFGQVVAVFMITLTNVSLVAVRMIMQDMSTGCNMMAIPPMLAWSVIVYSVLVDALMVIVMVVITFSAVKLIKHIVKTRKDVEAISGTNSGATDTRKGVCKFLIAIVIVKSIIILPYPLLQLLTLLGMNIARDAHQYVAVAFITLESFFNPTVFVFRPLMTQKDTKIFKNKQQQKEGVLYSLPVGDVIMGQKP